MTDVRDDVTKAVMSHERDIGRLFEAVANIKEHQQTTDNTILELRGDLREIVGKIDLLIQRNVREDGARLQRKGWRDGNAVAISVVTELIHMIWPFLVTFTMSGR